MSRRSGWEEEQARQFNALAPRYEAHYSDECSQRYRDKYYNAVMLDGLSLNGQRVLEAMCGSGQTTAYLLARGARVTGLDISSEQIASFQKRFPDCAGVCGSFLATPFEDSSFDCVVIVSGLHHLQPEVDRAVDEVYRILKPGGHFCFVEPHAGSIPDVFRRVWYKFDPFFLANEEAVDVRALQARNTDRFEFRRTRYLGNIAYLLVQNSLMFRVPVRLKRWYTPPLMALEACVTPLLTRRLACFVVGQWQKK